MLCNGQGEGQATPMIGANWKPQMIVEAVMTLNGPCRGAGQECKLLVSEVAAADGPRMLFLYQRWLPLVLQIIGGAA